MLKEKGFLGIFYGLLGLFVIGSLIFYINTLSQEMADLDVKPLHPSLLNQVVGELNSFLPFKINLASPAPSSSSPSASFHPIQSPSPIASASASPIPTYSPLRSSGNSLGITTSDDGKSFHIKVGDTINLSLKAVDGMQNWSIASSDETILEGIPNPAALAPKGVTTASFRAVKKGQADINGADRPICKSGQMCPQFILGWKVTIVVD